MSIVFYNKINNTLAHKRAYVKINNKNILHNIKAIKHYYHSKKLIIMLKANAYGHGIINVGRLLNRECHYFGVASIEEGVIMRANQINNKIIVFSGFFHRDQINVIEKNNLIPVIFNTYQFRMLKISGYFQRKKNQEIWLKFNSGMNRLGLNQENFEKVYSMLRLETKYLNALTHFAESDNIYSQFTNNQISYFHKLIKNKVFQNISSFNSGAILAKTVQDDLSNTIRIGISAYGVSTIPNTERLFQLLPAMSVFSKIISINNLKKGSYIGYDRQYRCNSNKRIAVVSFGYGDGYPQSDSMNNSFVMIHKTLCPVLGKISMDMLTVDITKLQNVHIGDIVVIFDSKNYTIEDLAKNLGIKPYYILTSITERVERIIN